MLFSAKRVFTAGGAVFTGCLLALLLGAGRASAFEPDALMLRNPDVSATQIVFAYDNNIWIAPKAGGMAEPLTTAAGAEGAAKFDADGTHIAYTANYDGSGEIYLLPVTGGVPKRLTWSPFTKSITGFAPDGSIVYISYGENPHWESYLYKIAPSGGAPEKLPVGYGAFNSFSADGAWMAFTPWTREGATWNRYTGGQATDIWLFNLKTYESKQITDWRGTDDVPMFAGDKIYYLSDQGPEHRRNIWVYGLKDGSRKQVTFFKDHETRYPSIGPSEIALENGGVLYLLSLKDESLREVHIQLPGDRPHLRPYTLDPSGNMDGASLSPHGKRIVAALRGDVWTFPAENGFPQELTRSDGSAEREPCWSPDGKWVAYFSDKNGEYDIYMQPAEGGAEQRLTSNANCFRSSLRFSPDSKKLSYVDKTGAYYVFLIDSQETICFDRDAWGREGGMVWAKDSNWLAYNTADEKTGLSVIKLYSLKDRKSWAVTSPMFNSGDPAFDLSGDYLYFSTNRSFQTSYSEVGDWGEYYFTNTGVMAVIPLRQDVRSPWAPKNDKEDAAATPAPPAPEAPKEPAKPAAADKPASKDALDVVAKKSDAAKPAAPAAAKPAEPAAPEILKIDMDGIEGRAIALPLEPGNYYNLAGGDHKLFYIRSPRSGSSGGDNQWCFYDLGGDNPHETGLLGGVGGFALTPDASKALLAAQGGLFITTAGPGAALDKRINTGGLSIEIEPRAEWRQLVLDAWRIYRDYFYDPNMHGVDWPAVRDRSLKLVDSAANRSDITVIISEMASDINSSHTYVWGGGEPGVQGMGFGMLGCDFELATDAAGHPGWRIKQLLHGAQWELDARSPLDTPGVDAKAGDFLLAVNGKPVSLDKGPYEALYGTAGRTVELTVNAAATADGKERRTLVNAAWGDGELRLRSWIEANRKYIFEKSGGKLGYIYVRDTSDGGAADFERQFYGQHELDGIIVDERWNGGGLSPEPMIAVMARQPRNYWAVRDGKSWRTPWLCHPGPQVLLENEKAGSGGDSFPWLWRKYGLGPIIGTRTWGGLIGISGNPGLIDGSGFSVPAFGIYDTDGTWAVENHGIDPDIKVVNDPTSLAKGQDKQLDTAIDVLLKELAAHPVQVTPKPPYPDRTGMNVPEKDW